MPQKRQPFLPRLALDGASGGEGRAEVLRALRIDRDRLQAVVDQMPAGVVIVAAPTGQMLLHNRAATDILGHPMPEARDHADDGHGRALRLDLTPYPPDQFPLARALRHGEHVRQEDMLYRRGDGAMVQISVSASPVRDPDGAMLMAVSTFEDVTARRDAEAAMRRTAARYCALAHAAGDMVWRVTENDFSMVERPGGSVTTARPPGEWIDKIHPDDRAATLANWERAKATRTGFEIEHRLQRGEGEWWLAVSRGVPVVEPDGRVSEWIGTSTDISGRRAAETALAAALTNTREILESITDAFYAIDADGRITYVNARAMELWGRSGASLLGRTLAEVFPQLPGSEVHEALQRVAAERQALHLEAFSPILQRWAATAIYPAGNGGLSVFFRDIEERRRADQALRDLNQTLENRVAARTAELAAANTQLRAEAAERARAEQTLRQVQKMEAIGQLTGGIAHDFNNMLQGIGGSLEMLRRRLAQGRPADAERLMAAALGGVARAAALTQRLLAFSRQQALDPRPVDVNQLVAAMAELVRRTVGGSVDVRTDLGEAVWPALCDANQLENAVLNLCINARDAMPDGGRLTIATANVAREALAAPDRRVPPGDYVMLRVTDTGTGMTADVAARAFDPFFTTKPLGQGTGLGLSMLYGFVRQSGGHVQIDSAPGAGTGITLWLPRHERATASEVVADGAAATPAIAAVPSATHVLVVEDEPMVRMLVSEVIGGLGYTVHEAGDGPAGLAALDASGPVDLLVTDVGLPGLNGRELAEAARRRRPGLKVLFITGYARDAALTGRMLGPDTELLTKPFTLEALAAKVSALVQQAPAMRAGPAMRVGPAMRIG
jgi:PAS domain S-box-containing protein